MIRALRRRHWRWMLVLAIVLPLLLLAFLGSRDFSPHDSVLPEALAAQGATSGQESP